MLGLVLDGGKLDGVVLRRTNGAVQKLQSFSAPLTLDPLTAAPELAGREIRNQLDAAGVRERDCVVGLPLKWVLTAQTELPPLPEADAASLLQLEAEKGFHTDAATLQIGNSRCALAGGKKLVLLGGIPTSARGRAGADPGGGETEAGQFCAGHFRAATRRRRKIRRRAGPGHWREQRGLAGHRRRRRGGLARAGRRD